MLRLRRGARNAKYLLIGGNACNQATMLRTSKSALGLNGAIAAGWLRRTRDGARARSQRYRRSAAVIAWVM
jgi:hypothetical protein